MSDYQSITVEAGSRLHFGLWAWGAEHDRQFGGVGMMIDRPAVVVRITPADEFQSMGVAADRLRQFAECAAATWRLAELPRCRIEALELPRQHTGLGVGTQLGLAAARGLAEWLGRDATSPLALATAAGRGLRSAVGTHGFAAGGLIVDAGKATNEPLGALAQHVTVPEVWRIVLISPRAAAGIAGEAERAAFARLPDVPDEVTASLQHIAFDELAPAVEGADFDRFSRAVYHYGYQAGMCFAGLQGGPYSTRETCNLVNLLRNRGIEGAGQSSWGPTIFAFTPSESAAQELKAWLDRKLNSEAYDLVVTKAKNDGATVASVARR